MDLCRTCGHGRWVHTLAGTAVFVVREERWEEEIVTCWACTCLGFEDADTPPAQVSTPGERDQP